MVIKSKTLIALSALTDKMEIDIASLESKTDEELGAKLLSVILKNLHKAEVEFYELIARQKECTVKEAEDVDIFEFIKDLVNMPGVADFFRSARGSGQQKSSASFGSTTEKN